VLDGVLGRLLWHSIHLRPIVIVLELANKDWLAIYAQSGKIDGLYYKMAKYHLVAVNKGFSMIFRISQKLAKKLKEGELPSLPLDENPYADWSAHLFTVARTQYIIMANTKSLYSVVMYGTGITDDSRAIAP
jgi:hypothetical protein